MPLKISKLWSRGAWGSALAGGEARRLTGRRAILALAHFLVVAGGWAQSVKAPLSNEFVRVDPAQLDPSLVGDHGSTIIELPTGELLCAWFHGDWERTTYGEIWSARLPVGATTWTTAVTAVVDESNKAMGNPVLWLDENNVVWLFYSLKNEAWGNAAMPWNGTGNSIENGGIMLRKSTDYGMTWSAPECVRGRVNTPGNGWLTGTKPIRLQNGSLALPVYRDYSTITATSYSYSKTDSLTLVSADNGATWTDSAAIYIAPWIAMPTLAQRADGNIFMFLRTPNSANGGKMYQTTGPATALTWSAPTFSDRVGSQARVAMEKLASGKFVVCHNVSASKPAASLSSNEGATWPQSFLFEDQTGSTPVNESHPAECRYPSVIQSRDGLIHVTYTWNGYHHIKHSVISEAWFAGATTIYNPTVGMRAPMQGAYFTSGNVTLQADAIDKDGTVTKVEFFDGATKLGETLAPNAGTATYNFAGVLANGPHSITAKATDNAGNTTTTRAVTFSVAASGGSLAGTVATGTTGNRNLTTEGTADWMHFGLGFNPATVNRKAGANQLGTLRRLGQGGNLSYTDSAPTFTWTGGAPTASATAAQDGIYANYTGSGFEITAPADTATRVLKLYVGSYFARGRISAKLSDGSAADYDNTSVVNATGSKAATYTLTYRAASAGQTLTVRWLADHNFATNSNPPQGGDPGNITVKAVTLAMTAPPTRTFAPDSLAGLKLWLSADSGVVASGANLVSQWTDRSGAGNDVTAAGSRQPLRVAAVLNGLPVIRFDGVDDRFTRNAVLATGNTSAFVLVNSASAPSGRKILDTGNTGVPSRRLITWDAAGFKAFEAVNANAQIGQWVLSSVIADNGAVTHWIGGANPATLAAAPQTPTVAPFTIGSRFSDSDAFPGDIAEVIVYDATLTDGQRKQVETYLRAKWLPGTLTAFESWRGVQGLPQDGAQDLANPSGDGAANLLKYALNLAPNAGDLALPNNRALADPGSTTVAALTGLPVLTRDGATRGVFTFLRRRVGAFPGIGYAVEWADAPGAFAMNPDATESSLALDPTWERVRATDSFTATQKPQRFARLRITAD